MVQKKQAFTLVELIVTIVILAILGAIAFINFGGYSRNTRDSARIADINLVQKGLAIFMTKTGFYPTPDNSQTITYNGGSAWIEGIIGENVIKNVQSVSKKPIDPLTSDEFTYSITMGKTEYQIGAISESTILGSNGINQSYAADISKSKALIRGTYNEKFLRVQTGSIQQLLVMPSIIVTDIGDPDLTRLIQNKKVVYNNYDNIPHSYNHNGSMTGGFDYEPGRGGDIVVLSGTTLTLSGNEDKIAFIGNVQDVLNGTILDGGEEYNSILDIDPADNTGAIILADDYIRGNIGGITGELSGLVGGSTTGITGGGDVGGEEETGTGGETIPTVCSLTQTQLEELNLYLTSGYIEIFDIVGNYIYPSTEEERCSSDTYEIDWHGGSNIPSGIWNLINLSSLDLTYNEISEIPSGLGNLTNLHELYISENLLTSLPALIGTLTNLNYLNANNNQLTKLSDDIINLVNLTYFDLRRNDGLGNLAQRFSKNYITTGVLYTENNITTSGETLTISVASGGSIIFQIGSLYCMTESEFNTLKSYDTYYGGSGITIYDHVDGNRIYPTDLLEQRCNAYRVQWDGGSTIPIELFKLENIKDLILSENSLIEIPIRLGDLLHLRYLDLSNNNGIGNLSTTFDINTLYIIEYGVASNGRNVRIGGNGTTIDIIIEPPS
ncbi:MAG: prepilin-type N-terminal cleavage/methylation domain-containing protein [Candidatus Gracilibacteria bacterium]|nr:prepilin-type N-terminal cleavage/methylation domain-containing protein [Candidatus Gracilibacteria bacterium]